MSHQQTEQFVEGGPPIESNGGGISLIDENNFLGKNDEQFVENDIRNQSDEEVQFVGEKSILCKQNEQYVENDDPGETNGGVHQADENSALIAPFQTGEGLPYAPVDWPCPGDNWSWKVGRRVNKLGYYHDRFLTAPKRIVKGGKQRRFASRSAVEKFIQSEFPGADIDAFFASFNWKIPGIPTPPKEEKAVHFPLEHPQDNTEKVPEEIYPSGRRKRKLSTPTPTFSENIEELNEETPRSTQRKEKKLGSSKKKSKQDLPTSSSKSKHTPSGTPNRKTRHSARQSSATAEGGDVGINEDQPAEIPEDFDNYLNSLEDILAKPLSENGVSQPASTDNPVAESQMAKLRSKLSSLLEMDFPSLVSSRNISKVTTLASQLRKDPTLTAEQLVKLKLIEEIPLFSEVFLESRGMIEQVDKCFSVLEGNKNRVNGLKNEYSELKEKADQLQGQVDSSSMTVQEIDNQIAQLQAWRSELMNTIENNKVAKAEVNSAQKTVANAIPGVVHEIQVANSKIPEWELKRTNAVKRVAEILEKFAPLQGFSL